MDWEKKLHKLTTFIRTKHVFKQRLKDLKSYDYDTVKVYRYELENLGCDNEALLQELERRGEIWRDKNWNFKALRQGEIKPSLLAIAKRKDKKPMPLSPLHMWMRNQLRHVTLPGVKQEDLPVYFKAFLQFQNKDLSPFFSVDAFSNRVHTPVVNLKGDLRFKLRFYGEEIVSLDVQQMQPTILAKVLYDSMGDNSFSRAIFNKEDVYIHLMKNTGIKERKDAKKYLFQLIFGPPSGDIGAVFRGENNWVDWINNYKSNIEPRNPHKHKMHTNLAWLLQYSEVQVMTGVWNRLKNKDIPFLSIHDELLCRKSDLDVAYDIMNQELKKHFTSFKINIDHDKP